MDSVHTKAESTKGGNMAAEEWWETEQSPDLHDLGSVGPAAMHDP